MFRSYFLLMPLLLGTACSPAPTAPETTESKVFVVRHAEKLGGHDPALSAAGQARAAALADLLATERIVRIFSTDTRRTRQTAAPLAERLRLQVELYDHRNQAGLAWMLRQTNGNALVVGHSNTIAETVAALAAAPGPAVADNEYDRLYVVTLAKDGTRAEIRRYGVN